VKYIPKKNINKKLADIRSVRRDNKKPDLPPTPIQAKADDALWAISQRADISAELSVKKNVNWKSFLAGFLVLVLLGGGFFVFGKYSQGKKLIEDVRNKFSAQKLPDSFKVGFSPVDESYFKVESFGDLNDKIIPLIKSGFTVYSNMAELAGKLIKVSDDVSMAGGKLPKAIFDGKPGEVLDILKIVQADLKDISATVDKVDDKDPKAKELINFVPSEYLSFKYSLKSFDAYLTELISWLEGRRSVFVFLQNPSEIRPTGGFWGSFAKIDLDSGSIATSTVRDINEIDRTLGLKYVPPKELYGVDTKLRLANSNWFLDFPKSGELATSLINSSGFASTSNVKADLVVAVSSNFVKDILEIVGPINLRGGKLKIDSENFISTLQSEVQKGHDAGSTYSKEVLQELQVQLYEKLKQNNSELSEAILNTLISRIKTRDIVMYSSDTEMQKIFKEENLAGDIFEIPKNFNGDYLAVSFANIGGAKTDYVIRQKISLDSQLSVDGVVNNKLEIERRHLGNLEKNWWYKTANQVYGRIYTPITSDVFSAKGGFDKVIYPQVSYKSYTTSPFIKSVEDTLQVSKIEKWLKIFAEGNKNIFGFWIKVDSGKTAKFTLEYSHPMNAFPKDGTKYSFVYDKQPGVSGSVHFSITAPAGYIFEESDAPIYEYEGENDTLLGRVAIDLTLKKEE
jgi:hypothetical protein